MILVHTADIHLGCIPDNGYPWAKKRSTDIWTSFQKVIHVAEEKHADFLLIAGDMFHRQPLVRELKNVNSIFMSIPDTQVVIIAGNHDCLEPSSSYLTFPWAPNVHFITSETMSELNFPDKRTVIHGMSYHRREIKDAVYDNLTAPKDGQFHILLAHGGDEKHIPINFKKLGAAGFDYVALGHIHKPKTFDGTLMAYCGSPEPIDRTETGPRGCITVELEGYVRSIQFVHLASVSYVPLTIELTPDTTLYTLRHTISDTIDINGRENIFKIRLTGKCSHDFQFQPDAFEKLGNIIEIVNESVPDYQIDQLLIAHRNDIIGNFIRDILKDRTSEKELTPIEQKALYYGLNALLNDYS